ncbi:hypothetical protein T492DRAFT_1051641 [Pavlovales sp. CCMP2436]|nr:hypothetical protein T492DRAFT_1051641 [Pavlovales sp. CCMP2436]
MLHNPRPLDRARAEAKGLDVRPSLVVGAGEGLFALRGFLEGELVCEYVGRVLSLAEVMRMSVPDRDYVMGGFGLNVHVDGRHNHNMLARYINDNGDPALINAEFVKLRAERKALVRALRPLRAGEEIFCAYGEGYWRARQKASIASVVGETPVSRRFAWQFAARVLMLGAPLLAAWLVAARARSA